jgi:hypothetical protein
MEISGLIKLFFTLMIHRYPKVVTEVNNLHPNGMYYFDINGFIERPIK